MKVLMMKEGILMRVLFCKIQCPFMCFCKPSSSAAASHHHHHHHHHLYTSSSGPLKLENKSQLIVPSTTAFTVSINNASEKSSSGEVKVNGKKEDENVLKSCMRKFPYGPADNNTKEVAKKRVQWIDISGKELAEIKEFESSETGDSDTEEESSRCLCIIL